MAVRFAIASGNWSSVATWDNGAVPVAGDDVWVNGFTVTLDTNLTVQSLRNDIANCGVYLPNIATPAMTGSNTPSGFASANSNSSTAYLAFDQLTASSWASTTNNTGIIQYQFPAAKTIRRYALRTSNTAVRTPRSWTFDGSNDGSVWTVLDTQTNLSLGTNSWFVYGIASPASYLYYRLNITAVNTAGNTIELGALDMTESTGTVYAITAGGSFTLNGGLTVDCTSNTGSGLSTNATTLITFTTGTSTINCPLIVAQAANGTIRINSSGTLNVIGTIAAANGASAPVIFVNGSNSTLNITGNITASSNSVGRCIEVNGAVSGVTLNIVGTVNGNGSSALQGYTNATINITGNVNGGAAGVGTIVGGNGCTMTVNGNVTAGTVAGIALTTTTTVLTINGNVIASTACPAVSTTSASSTVTINGSLTNAANGMMAYQGYKLFTSTTAARAWNFTKSDATARPLLDASQIIVGGSYPAVGDVRNGLSYGAGLYTGTCVLPAANTVALGTLIDVSTTGTAVLPSTMSTQLWNTLVSSLVTSGSIGERLKNCATVDMTGYQIAALL